MNTPEISIVVPLYNEIDCIDALLLEIDKALTPFARPYEIIIVDDGSNDGSTQKLEELCKTHDNLRLIRFRRNCGQAAAFDAGFAHASGSLIATLDADLQNDPADIPRLIEYLESENLDFVSGCRAARKDKWVSRKLPSKIANWMIRTVTRTNVRDLGCSLKVYRAEIVKEIRLYGEMHRFLAVLIEGSGARIGQLDVNHRSRTTGQSKYGLSRTFKVLLDLVTVWFMRGFQTNPIYAFGGISLLLITMATGLSAFVLYDKIFHGIFVHRNPLFILSMVMAIISVQFLAMGVLAEIMIRTYFESRGKPAYTIAFMRGFESVNTPPDLKATVHSDAVKILTTKGI